MNKQPKKTIEANGTVFWMLHSKLHREDGPAIEHANGCKSWFLNGKRHREDGPAIEDVNGYRAWYLHGKVIKVVGGAK